MTTTNIAAGLETTYPYTASPEVARHQCLECGAWERADKGRIRHSRRCESQPQAPVAVAAQPAAPATTSYAELERFARRVRRTGLTGGRDQDVYDAVRAGLLSESAAMNTDD